METAKAPTFGRRGALAKPRLPVTPAPAKAGQAWVDGVPPDLADIARNLKAEVARERGGIEDARDGVVPWSMRAAFLAGLFASLLQAGIVVASARGIVEIIPGFKFDIGEGSAITPLIIVSGVMSGARVAAGAVMLSHFLLRTLGRTGVIDYALGGAAAGAANALIVTLLFGASHGFMAETLTGLAAGSLFRLFAGRLTSAKSGIGQ